MRERRYTVSVTNRTVGTGIDKQTNNRLMVGASIPQNHRFDQSSPSQIVYVIQRRTRVNQTADNLYMP